MIFTARKDRFLRFPDGRSKALTISYDDGCYSDRKLVELMSNAGVKGTFNISANRLRSDDEPVNTSNVYQHMTTAECLETYRPDICEVAIHGYDHYQMTDLDNASVCGQILDDRRSLEALFGRQIRGMAYPYGSFNDAVVEIAKLCGIRYSRTTVSTGKFTMPKSEDEWLRLPVTCHHKSPQLMELCDKFLSMEKHRHPQMFYLWGHTYEFGEKGNWYVIEEFLNKMKGHDDIWYATNVEIYQVWEDFQRLETSADGSRIYNPNLRSVWFATFSGDVYEVSSGQTVTLE